MRPGRIHVACGLGSSRRVSPIDELAQSVGENRSGRRESIAISMFGECVVREGPAVRH